MIKTVADLRAVLINLPNDMQIIGYDGFNDLCDVLVYVNDFKDVNDGSKPKPTLIIDVTKSFSFRFEIKRSS